MGGVTPNHVDRLASAVDNLRHDNETLRGLVLMLLMEHEEARRLVDAAKAVMSHETPQTPAGRAALQHYRKVEANLKTPEELANELPSGVRELVVELIQLSKAG